MKMSASHLRELPNALRKHSPRYEVKVRASAIARMLDYYALLLEWNQRLHLVAPCSPTEFATRHILESLLLLPHLKQDARVADIGSGAGLPIIPNLIVRPDIHATLIESSKRKGVFLREALRITKTAEQTNVIAERFENVPTPEVDYVTCRALDRFGALLPGLVKWSPQTCTLLLFGGDSLRSQIESVSLNCSSVHIPDSERRFLFVVHRNKDVP